MNPETNKKTPIVLFVYNRPEHTRKTVEALQKNNLAKESELYIFSDSARHSFSEGGRPKDEDSKIKVQKVRDYVKTLSGFKKIEVIEREENFGLAKSIISGVTEIVNKYGKVIVLEDDLVTSPFFLEYMNEALDLYEKEEKIISIHGYTLPVKKSLPETFFLKGADCWGWATWQRGWNLFKPDGKKLLTELEKRNLIKEFNFNNTYDYSGMLKRQIEGKNDSWAIRWYASAFLADKLTLYPGKSLVQNIGQDESGTHTTKGKIYDTNISDRKINVGNIKIVENKDVRKHIIQYFKSLKPNIFKKIIKKLFRC